jgi:hypothetical protein
MSLTVKNCLNRWCLRSAHTGGAVGFIKLLHQERVSEATRTKLKGRPPLRLACIAPYCHHWEVVDAERGNCLIRCLVRSAAAPAEC